MSQYPAATPRSGARTAAGALLLATVFWGCSFTWAKAGGAAVNRHAGLPDGSLLGPILLLAIRFTLAGVAWMAIFPAARRGWSGRSLLHSGGLGLLLAAGSVAQVLGLDRTSEAVSAFLTALTILFVPLLMALGLRRPPRAIVWLGVLLATLGIWLLTGATPNGFGLGEALGLACSVLFSVYIIAINLVLVRESPWRITGGQFLAVGLMGFITCLFLRGGLTQLRLGQIVSLAATPHVMSNLLPLVVFPTLLSYGIMTHFQPRLDPSQAALIYLIEPVVAALFAMGHRPLTGRVCGGAVLILLANLLVELLQARGRTESAASLADS